MDLSMFRKFFSSEINIKFIYSIVAITVAWLLRLFILRHSWGKTKEAQERYITRKILNTLLSIIVISILIMLWIEDFSQLGTILGIMSAGIAIALKDPLVNIAGLIFITLRRPFVIGDRIQIGGHSGDVIDISMFQFSMLEIGNWVDSDQSTGRIIHLPNGIVFSQSLANYTKGFDYIWNEIRILLTFESDWEKAKTILDTILQKNTMETIEDAQKQIKNASKKYLIVYKNLTPIIYTNVEASGVRLTLRYLCRPRSRRSTEHVLWEAILKAFAGTDDIEFAYPTQRFYTRPDG